MRPSSTQFMPRAPATATIFDIVTGKNHEAIAGIADSARHRLARYVLLHGHEDVIEKIRGKRAGDRERSKSVIPTGGVNLH